MWAMPRSFCLSLCLSVRFKRESGIEKKYFNVYFFICIAMRLSIYLNASVTYDHEYMYKLQKKILEALDDKCV